MENSSKTTRTFKDSRRAYWRITIWHAGERPNGLDDGSVDYDWGHRIARSESGDPSDFREIYYSEITGQYDIPPKLTEFFHDYLSYVMDAMLVWAASGKTE